MKIPQSVKESLVEKLLPRPQRVTYTGNDLVLSRNSRIVVGVVDDAGAVRAARRLADMIRDEFGYDLAVVENRSVSGYWMVVAEGEEALGSVSRDDFGAGDGGAESYCLRIDGSGAVLGAVTMQGLLWAAMTFRQLLGEHEGIVAACGVEIEDWPTTPWRGFMIDSARAPNSMAKMKRIIRVCSAFKLNYVIFREGDDELNAVRYRSNKLGSNNPYALSMSQMREFVDYAEGYGITVVPEIESLGHSVAKGFHYPDLLKGGFEQHYEGLCSHMRKAYLDPANGGSYTLLESVYDEWFDIIRSPYVHLGLDEVPAPAELQQEHLERLLGLVASVGKRHGRDIEPIVWSDAPPTPRKYVERTIRCPWCYHEHFDGFGEIGLENDMLIKQGVDRLCLPGCRERFIAAGGSGSGIPPYSKCSYEGAIRNLENWTKLAQGHDNWHGLLAVQWSGNMIDRWFPDFLSAADFGWQVPGQETIIGEHMQRINGQLGRIADAARPGADEIDRPAWDGIWIKDGVFFEDIMTKQRVETLV